jgi:hypothetical protein
MVDSRNKGAAFERDIVKRLNVFFEENDLEVRCKRNLDQYQAKDLCDIEIPGYAIECKAYKSGWWFSQNWWKQVCDAAGERTPVLIWKFNNKPIRVTLPISSINAGFEFGGVAVVAFEDWLDLLKQEWIETQRVA